MAKTVNSFPVDQSGRAVNGGVSKDDSTAKVPFQMDPATGACLVSQDYVPPTAVALTVLNTANNAVSAALGLVGITSLISIDAPSINGSGATYTVSFLDADDKVFYVSGNNAENASSLIAITRRLVATDKIKVTTSVTVGADKAFALRIR